MVDSTTSTQIFKFDVIKLAKQLLNEIESYRSYEPLPENDIGPTTQVPNESRINTFFRLIGFPSIVSVKALKEFKDTDIVKESDASILTLGFHLGNYNNYNFAVVKNSEKKELEIEDATGKKKSIISKALKERENKLKLIDSSFDSKSNENRLKAFKNPLSPRMDFSGKYQGRTTYKRLSPFITSYRDIYPRNRLLSKPFLSDPRDGFLINSELKRPFIETVILIRLVSLSNASDENTKKYIKQMKDYLINQEKIANKGKQTIKYMSEHLPENGSVIELYIIDHMIMIIPELAKKWNSLIHRINEISQKVSVSLLPQTSGAKQNPIGKQSNNMAIELKVSEGDTRIAQLEALIRKSEAIISLMPIQDSIIVKKEKGKNKSQASSRNVMSNALTSPFISILRQDIDENKKKLKQLKQRQKNNSQKADRLRLELEMMTGEFSGISLPDIIFTIMSLFLIEKKYLLALLDSDVIKEMEEDDVLKQAIKDASVSGNPTEALEASKKIRQIVMDLYTLFDTEVKAFNDKSKRNATTNKSKSGKTTQPKAETDRIIGL